VLRGQPEGSRGTASSQVQNAFIESFNSKFRDECLNEYVFTCLREARAMIEVSRHDYNRLLPHSVSATWRQTSSHQGIKGARPAPAPLGKPRAGRRGAMYGGLESKT